METGVPDGMERRKALLPKLPLRDGNYRGYGGTFLGRILPKLPLRDGNAAALAERAGAQLLPKLPLRDGNYMEEHSQVG